jgi:hypothetical protein
VRVVNALRANGFAEPQLVSCSATLLGCVAHLADVEHADARRACRSVADLPRSGRRKGRGVVKRILLALAVLGTLASAGSASAAWSLVGTNVVASSPVAGGGYPVPPGSTKPLPGTCGPQMLNSNHSES